MSFRFKCHKSTHQLLPHFNQQKALFKKFSQKKTAKKQSAKFDLFIPFSAKLNKNHIKKSEKKLKIITQKKPEKKNLWWETYFSCFCKVQSIMKLSTNKFKVTFNNFHNTSKKKKITNNLETNQQKKKIFWRKKSNSRVSSRREYGEANSYIENR